MNKLNQSQANIHPEARIADNVKVEPFATIGRDVEIGEGSWIGPNTVIMDGARIGKNCKNGKAGGCDPCGSGSFQ